jgi:hypothetical protein
MGNVRVPFSPKENIQISQHAAQVLKRFEEEMATKQSPSGRFRAAGREPVPRG